MVLPGFDLQAKILHASGGSDRVPPGAAKLFNGFLMLGLTGERFRLSNTSFRPMFRRPCNSVPEYSSIIVIHRQLFNMMVRSRLAAGWSGCAFQQLLCNGDDRIWFEPEFLLECLERR